MCRLFRWYTRRLIRKSFNAMRIDRAGADVLRNLDTHDGPTMVLLTHSSWWDPIISVVLVDRFAPRRQVIAPMDRAMLERFEFMRRLGLFGVDPDDPAAFRDMVRYAADECAQLPNPSFWLTPQGGFTDVREPIELRPGAAAIAARLGREGMPPRVACVAIELVFWGERTPELLTLARPCPAPMRPSTGEWQRAMTDALRAAAGDLAERSIARDASAFETIVGRGDAGMHPVYDLYLRAIGKEARVRDRRDAAEVAP